MLQKKNGHVFLHHMIVRVILIVFTSDKTAFNDCVYVLTNINSFKSCLLFVQDTLFVTETKLALSSNNHI